MFRRLFFGWMFEIFLFCRFFVHLTRCPLSFRVLVMLGCGLSLVPRRQGPLLSAKHAGDASVCSHHRCKLASKLYDSSFLTGVLFLQRFNTDLVYGEHFD
jgi:hypothetical protein